MNEYQYRSSSAYQYGAPAERRYPNRQEDRPREVRRPEHKLQKKAQAVKERPAKTLAQKLKTFAVVTTVFALSVLVVFRYVQIWESGAYAEKLKEDYNTTVAANEDIQAQISSSIDLKQLEEIAHDRLGMIRPERYQIFYVDMQNNDHSETVQESSPSEQSENSGTVASVPGMLISALELLK